MAAVAAMKVLASATVMVSMGGSPSEAVRSSTIATSGWSRRITPSLHRDPAGPSSLNPR